MVKLPFFNRARIAFYHDVVMATVSFPLSLYLRVGSGAHLPVPVLPRVRGDTDREAARHTLERGRSHLRLNARDSEQQAASRPTRRPRNLTGSGMTVDR